MYRYNGRITKKDLDRFVYSNTENNNQSSNSQEEQNDDQTEQQQQQQQYQQQELQQQYQEKRTPPKCEKGFDLGIAELVVIIGILCGSLKVSGVLITVTKTIQVYLDGSVDPKKDEDQAEVIQDLLKFAAGGIVQPQ